ncbi:MAG: hypothetical protein KKH29_02460 [Candidatus Omnitrophica bacterium]|nr:hypothetical protein [Candidatus Omnitrophota bacterium]MBU4473643.1 hypothetical protein [Candidatus Omnitrophota bacterium]MCG2707028.1 hypothetical protein [Candidatus Omnitrophota bacterium]
MKQKVVIGIMVLGLLFLSVSVGLCQEKVIFGFEESTPVWEVPDWCYEKDDYVAEGIVASKKFAKEGESSLEITADFPGARWTAAYVEAQEYFDWTPYKSISVDAFLPEDAPFGLTAKIILTVGEDWKWTEMARSGKLIPGEWTTITASLIPGSTDWRRTQVTEEFRADVRKLGVRIESNMRPVYKGAIYIDNVRLE